MAGGARLQSRVFVGIKKSRHFSAEVTPRAVARPQRYSFFLRKNFLWPLG